MAELKIYKDSFPLTQISVTTNKNEMNRLLGAEGVRYEQWETPSSLEPGASQEAVIEAYQSDIDRLINENGYQSVDVISLSPEHPDRIALRKKFLDEHTHKEDEVRFFVAGQGLFSLHIGNKVYEVLCSAGDLISVPANTPHWFDMGSAPSFIAIRLFNNPEGWVAHYTGEKIADKFNRLA